MLYDGETFYYENYFYDLQTHEKSISKIVFNLSSVTTGNNLFQYYIRGVVLVTINEYYPKTKVIRVACVWLISFCVL